MLSASDADAGEAPDPTAQQILRDVQELGRQAREFKNSVSPAKIADSRQIRKHKLKDRVRDMLKSLTRTHKCIP